MRVSDSEFAQLRQMIEAKRKPAQRESVDSEAKWQSEVRELATLYGYYLQYHANDSRRSDPGWPDLVLLRPGRTLFIELKTNEGKLTVDQDRWIKGLRANGHECHVWRPRDREQVLKVLSGKETSDER